MSNQSEFILYNGKFLPEGTLLITAENRSFRFGEGLFETMRFQNNRIALWELHMDRLYHGLELLQFRELSWSSCEELLHHILHLVKLNLHQDAARIRLQVFLDERMEENTGLRGCQYLVQTYPLAPYTHNSMGMFAGFHPQVRKSCDMFARIKSSNFLSYIQAALYAKANGWDECFVLNQYERICDASVSNVFWIKNNEIFTTPLSEGPVAGVMRQHLLLYLSRNSWNIRETQLDLTQLLQADEVFVTNAVRGIQSVTRFADITYGRDTTNKLLQYLPW